MSAICKRCGEPFESATIDAGTLQIKLSHCETCQTRNFMDALNLPTPPELIDMHSKRPTLSEREYVEVMRADAKPKRRRLTRGGGGA